MNTHLSTESDSSKRSLNWPSLIWIPLVHLGALLAFVPAAFSWSGLGICVLLHWLTAGIGICLCYNRLLTHRSFQLVKPLEYLFTFFGGLAVEGGALRWVGAHRMHHQFSDGPGDPHSSKEGFWWSHMLWLFTRGSDTDERQMWERYVPDLLKDPIHRLLYHTHFFSSLALSAGLYAAGHWIGGVWLGISWLVWGICVRMVLVYHGTWFVNSASHVWGYRNFQTGDESRNLWWVALVSYGEGWHNNHHAYQRSATHGMRWWEFDMTYWTIRLLAFLRLARKIELPAEAFAALR